MEWYDWGPYQKCGQSYTERNLYQCVDKSECKHIFCLGCLLVTMNSNVNDYVRCPIIYIVALVWTHPDNITFLLNLLELCQITKCMISVREFKSQAAKLYVWLADKA